MRSQVLFKGSGGFQILLDKSKTINIKIIQVNNLKNIKTEKKFNKKQ